MEKKQLQAEDLAWQEKDSQYIEIKEEKKHLPTDDDFEKSDSNESEQSFEIVEVDEDQNIFIEEEKKVESIDQKNDEVLRSSALETELSRYKAENI